MLRRNGQKGLKKNKKPVKQNIKGKMGPGTTGITKPFVQRINVSQGKEDKKSAKDLSTKRGVGILKRLQGFRSDVTIEVEKGQNLRHVYRATPRHEGPADERPPR